MSSQPTTATIKRLFAASGGRCSFPACSMALMLANGGLVAEIAHIRAASPGGPRFDASHSAEERNGYENLIVLCPTHHAIVDRDAESYTASALIEMKRRHEAEISRLLGTKLEFMPTLESAAATQLARQVDPSVTDFAIVTALREELDAVLAYFPTLERVRVEATRRTYYQGMVMAHDGMTRYRVVAALLRGTGNLETATDTAELLRDWNPRYIVVCGLAVGLRRHEQRPGDIVVGTNVAYYELSKVRKGQRGRRAISYNSDPLLLDRARHMHQGDAWRARLPFRPNALPVSSQAPAVHFGPIASGETIIASTNDAKKLLELDRTMIAVDMEAGGVAASAVAAANRVGFFEVRAISDAADHQEVDSWRRYAACAAASFLAELIATRPVAPGEGTWVPVDSEERVPNTVPDPRWVRSVFFPALANSLDIEGFKDLCYLLHVNVDGLRGATKRAKLRELLLRAERDGRLPELIAAYQQLLRLTS